MDSVVGVAGSADRAMFLKQVVELLSISLRPSQRNVVMAWDCSVLELPAAPGVGKTNILEVITMVSLLHSERTKSWSLRRQARCATLWSLD